MGYQKTVLDNGIRVVTEEMSGVRTVTLGLSFELGSRQEKPEQSGISHFIEHMMFKGTRRRTAREIAQAMDRVGGHMDASTGKESTLYYAKVQAQKLEFVFEILADLLLHSTFEPKDVSRERQVIMEELKMVEDAPEEAIWDHYAGFVWAKHALGRPILGSSEVISTFTAGQLREYFTGHYIPERMVVGAAGAMKHQEVVRLVKRFFGKLRTPGGVAPLARYAGTQPPHFFAGQQVVKKKLEQVHCCLGVQGLTYRDPRRVTASVLNCLFGGSMSSRLFQELREKRGLVYAVYSMMESYHDTGLWLTYFGASPKKFRETVEVILEELGLLYRRGVSKQELANAKENLKGSLVLTLEGTGNNLSKLLRDENYLNDHEKVDRILDTIEKVKEDDVSRLAGDLFKGKELSLVALGPVEQSGMNSLLSGGKLCSL